MHLVTKALRNLNHIHCILMSVSVLTFKSCHYTPICDVQKIHLWMYRVGSHTYIGFLGSQTIVGKRKQKHKFSPIATKLKSHRIWLGQYIFI